MPSNYQKAMSEIKVSNELKDRIKASMEQESIKQNAKRDTFKMKLKRKIITLISALSIFSVGGVAFACVISEDVRTSIKAFFGIVSIEQYEEAKTDTNVKIENNGYSLTLEDYGMDAETLLLSFDFQTKDEIDLEYPFYEEIEYYFRANVKIVDENNKEYLISDENEKLTVLLNKINSKEYKIYQIYTLNSNNIARNGKLYIDFYLEYLPEDARELIYNKVCEFNFEVPITTEKIDNTFKEYSIKAGTTWDSYGSTDSEKGKVTAQITKIKNSNILTKLTLQLDGDYHTNTMYTLKITDENNNIILDRDIEYIIAGVGPGSKQDIIIPRADMNSKINITFYEEDSVYNEKTETYTKTDIVDTTMTLDLSNIDKK